MYSGKSSHIESDLKSSMITETCLLKSQQAWWCHYTFPDERNDVTVQSHNFNKWIAICLLLANYFCNLSEFLWLHKNSTLSRRFAWNVKLFFLKINKNDVVWYNSAWSSKGDAFHGSEYFKLKILLLKTAFKNSSLFKRYMHVLC